MMFLDRGKYGVQQSEECTVESRKHREVITVQYGT